MDAAVVVLSQDLEASRRAASYMGRLVSECTHGVCLVIPDGVEAPPEIAHAWGATRTIGGVALEAINAAVNAAVEAGAEIVHLLDSRVMLGANWRSSASMARVMWSACGPCGPQLQGSQRLNVPSPEDFIGSCAHLGGQHVGRFAAADWLGPEAVALSAQAWRDIGGFDATMGSLTWALRDWCLRVRDAGSRVVVVPGCYTHVMGPRLSPWDAPDLPGRLALYVKYASRTSSQHRVAGLVLSQPQNLHQFQLLKRSITALSRCCDAIVLALTDHPAGYATPVDGVVALGKDSGLLAKISGMAISDAAEAFADWAGKLTGVRVHCGIVEPGWTSHQELEATAATAVQQLSGATWCVVLREGEILGPGWTPDRLHHLASHPDPGVSSYNVGVRYTWDTRRCFREDAPYGDDRSLRDDGKHSNDARFFRLGNPRIATDGARVANLVVLNTAIEDPRTRRPQNEQGMRLSPVAVDHGISGHMLAYPGEDPDGVARWLDWTHGLVEEWVIGWTDPEQTPERDAVLDLVGRFGQSMLTVGHGGHDFAEWRNAAMGALGGGPVPWHVFVDPDEWVDHPVHDLMCWRRMSEQADRYAWLQRFTNHRAGGGSNQSSVVRMFRTGLGLRFDGLVHEALGETLLAPQRTYGQAGIGTAPVVVQNRATAGLAMSHQKLELYTRLIRQQLVETPRSSRHWVLLSYQYAADGHVPEALECLNRAVECGSATAFLPHWDRAMLHLREARADLQHALRRIPPGDERHAQGAALLGSLQDVADAAPRSEEQAPEPPAFPPME